MCQDWLLTEEEWIKHEDMSLQVPKPQLAQDKQEDEKPIVLNTPAPSAFLDVNPTCPVSIN